MKTGLVTPVWGCFDIKCDVGWLKRIGVRGVVIGCRIRFADKPEDLPQWVFRHELEHAYQIIRDGRFQFYLKFFYYQIRYGYHDNPYEIEARQAQSRNLTTYEEQVLWKLKEGSMPLPNDSEPKSNTSTSSTKSSESVQD